MGRIPKTRLKLTRLTVDCTKAIECPTCGGTIKTLGWIAFNGVIHCSDCTTIVGVHDTIGAAREAMRDHPGMFTMMHGLLFWTPGPYRNGKETLFAYLDRLAKLRVPRDYDPI